MKSPNLVNIQSILMGVYEGGLKDKNLEWGEVFDPAEWRRGSKDKIIINKTKQ